MSSEHWTALGVLAAVIFGVIGLWLQARTAGREQAAHRARELADAKAEGRREMERQMLYERDQKIAAQNDLAQARADAAEARAQANEAGREYRQQIADLQRQLWGR